MAPPPTVSPRRFWRSLSTTKTASSSPPVSWIILKPTAADLPNIEGDRLETPSPLTLLGTKGVGEGGAVVAPAAIASAVEDALAPLGIHIAALPIVPSRLCGSCRSRLKTLRERAEMKN